MSLKKQNRGVVFSTMLLSLGIHDWIQLGFAVLFLLYCHAYSSIPYKMRDKILHFSQQYTVFHIFYMVF